MIRYPFLVIISLAFSLLAYIMAPILPLFAKPADGPLDNGTKRGVGPRLTGRFLSLFMTPDNALTGDSTFASQHNGGYWSQVVWLWRNPGYGFDLLLGVPPWEPVREVPRIGDNPGVEGFRCYRNGSAFNSLWVKRLYGTRCLHWEFGWKFDTGALVFSPRFSQLK